MLSLATKPGSFAIPCYVVAHVPSTLFKRLELTLSVMKELPAALPYAFLTRLAAYLDGLGKMLHHRLLQLTFRNEHPAIARFPGPQRLLWRPPPNSISKAREP